MKLLLDTHILLWAAAGTLPARADTGEHALAVKDLPSLHKDPFDRILLTQAVCGGLTFLTCDKVLKEYPGPIAFVQA